jgi:hypothetical protein
MSSLNLCMSACKVASYHMRGELCMQYQPNKLSKLPSFQPELAKVTRAVSALHLFNVSNMTIG